MARSTRRFVPAALCALLAPASAQSGDAVAFHVSGSVTLPSVQLVQRALAGDVNGDGNLDLVVAMAGGVSATLLGGGDGTLAAPLDNHALWRNPALGDLDGDGRADLVTVNGDETHVTVSLGLGDGTFGSGADFFAASSFPNAVALAALDADAGLDVAVGFGDFSPSGVSVLSGAGDGSLGFVDQWSLGPDIFSIEVGDLNGDGTAEILAGEDGSVVFTDAGGALVSAFALPLGGAGVAAALGDVTGDGLGDVVAAWFAGGTFVNGTFAGTGGSALAAAVPFASAALSDRSLGDFDQDGRLDLLGEAAGGVVLAIGAGDGTFADAQSVVTAAGCSSAPLVGDMDGDGVADVIADVLCGGSRTLTVHLNDGPAAWKDLGHGLTGRNGVPDLTGLGDLSANSTARLQLHSAAPLAAVVLVFGADEALLPFKGGVLVPSAGIAVSGLLTDASGKLALAGHVPALPSGLDFFVQAWIADASAPKGFSASNGLRAWPP